MRERIEKVKSRTPAVPTGYTGRKVQTMRGLTDSAPPLMLSVRRLHGPA